MCNRPAPSTCLICFDFLLVYDNTEEARDPEDPTDLLRPVVALKCGHLFHTSCVNDWFKNAKGKNQKLKPCPICRREMGWCDTKRYIPIPYDFCRKKDVFQTPSQSHYRPAPSVCLICDDYLLVYANATDIETEQVDSADSVLRPVVALKCGHLFHTSCVNTRLFGSSPGAESSIKACPYCRREMWRWDIKRIFPVTSGEE